MANRILFLIFLLDLFLRLLGLINISLGGDFAVHWGVASEIIHNGKLPLLGPHASVNPSFNLGPFYYYLLAIPYFLGGGDFRAGIIFFSLLSAFSIFLFYQVCRQWFSSTLSLKICAFYAFSSYIITIGNFPWNPYILPILTIVSLYFLTRVLKGKVGYVLPLFFTLGLIVQSHATAIFLLPVFLLSLPYRKINIGYLVLGVFLFLISLLPWLIANYSCQFCQVKEGIKVILVRREESCNFWQWLSYHGHGESCFHQIRTTLFVFRMMAMSLFGTQNIVVVFLTFLATVWVFVKINFPQKKFFLLWILVPTFLFLFYSSNVYLHYFLIFIPLPFVLLGLILKEVEKYHFGKLASPVIFYSILGLNMFLYLISLNTYRV